jgi:phosphoenolpyruvate synthase/pyruvate phosphate dikinase
MPGMMDTILNLGLNDEAVLGLARKAGNERFAWDSYRRFVQMYGDVVMGLKPVSKEDHDPFEVDHRHGQGEEGRQARHRTRHRRPARNWWRASRR